MSHIDLIIPCIEDDIPMLGLALEGARKCVEERIGKVFVVAPSSPAIKEACGLLHADFVDERVLMGFCKDDLQLPTKARKGWIYQQLIKLNGGELTKKDEYLVLDADHVLLQPHSFVMEKGYRFYTSTEYHLPYFYAIERLFGGTVRKTVQESFISDKMIFNRRLLEEMKAEIRQACGCPWTEAIACCCSNNSSGFSEFETYGSWLYARYPELVHLVPDGRLRCRRHVDIRNNSYADLTEMFQQYASVTELKK